MINKKTNPKKFIGKKVNYKDYDGSIIPGVIKMIAFSNKDFSICWFNIDFGHKAFMVSREELIMPID